jgi:hypothetical protein
MRRIRYTANIILLKFNAADEVKLIRFYHLHEDVLWYINSVLPQLERLLLPFLLLLKQFHLASNIATVEIAGHVFTKRRE